MPDLPSGTVTFLFTDMAGSTSLLQRLGPEGYAAELAEHRRIVREACSSREGVEVDTQGDAFFFAFARAADAVAAAQAVCDGLAGGPAPARIGLHTGEPLVTAEGYVGIDVNRAARIAAAGHGGQVLVSRVTHALVPDVLYLDLGEQRLKDLAAPERLYQLGTQEFPPPKSLNRTNLPLAAHPLVGRVGEQEELLGLLRERRLVTLTGPGGAGKTRLALQVAAELLGEVVDGVFFVNLAEFTDPELVVPAVLEAFGADESTPEKARGLVLLDNFEHLVEAAPAVARLLADAPGLKLLVTSRMPLRVSGEIEVQLEPLPEDDAVELFLDRAQALRRELGASDTIAAICRRLDGLPLALELAAARLRLLDPAALLARLDARLPLLTQGARDLPERQRTLEATIAWSYDLLTPEARALFVRLSIFAGTFSLDAAEEVAGADLDLLERLVDASLMKPIREGRFLLLQTIREFAGGRLDPEEQKALAARHTAHYLRLAEAAEPQLTGAEGPALLDLLEADQANLREALDRLTGSDELARMTSALWRFWLLRGHFHEAESWIEQALELDLDDARRAELLYRCGALVISQGKTAESERLFADALGLYRAVGSRRGEARALMALGHAEGDAGEWEQARGHYEQAIVLSRELGDEPVVAGVLGDLAGLLLRAGQPEEALAVATESLALQRELGFEQGVAVVQATQGYACLLAGDREQARELLVAATRAAHRLGHRHALVYSLNGLGRLTYEADELDCAALAFAAARRLAEELGIEEDADEILVAAARSAVEAASGAPVADEVELDRVVEVLTAVSPADRRPPSPPAGETRS